MALTKITGQVVDTTTDLVVGVTTVGGGISATDGFFSGIVTAVGDASFSGNVSVGGTLTYEDVTNIDAVGLVTARNGIVVGSGITLSKDGDIFATGVTTSTTFVGNLTGNVTGNSDTATNSTNSSHVLVTDNESTNENNLITFVEDATSSTGNVGLEMDGNLTYNPSTGTVTATKFVGDGSGLTGIGGTDFIHSEQINNSGVTTSQAFIPSVGQLANRNLVVNGAMRVAQRGTTYTGGYGTGVAGDYYKTVDRMFVHAANLPNTDVTTSQVSLTSGSPYDLGFRKSFRITMGYQGSVPASVKVSYQHRMEAQDIACSGWKHTSSSSYLTLSFWVKSSVAQTFYGQLRTIDGTSYHYPFSYALSADTWTKVEKTIPGNSNLTVNNDNGEGLRIDLSPYYGTDETNNSVTLNAWGTHSNSAKTPDQTSTWYSTNGATFEVTGLQLEVGQVATPFEHKKYADELQQCLRYYERQSANDGNGGYATVAHGYRANSTRIVIEPVFRVYKRAVNANFEFDGPMRVFYYANSSDYTIDSFTTIQNSQFGLHGGYIVLDRSGGVGGSNGGTFRMEGNGDASSYIAFDSEL